MPVIRERIGSLTSRTGSIGVVRQTDTSGIDAVAQSISNFSNQMYQSLYRDAVFEAQKAGVDLANSQLTEDILAIDPTTGEPLPLANAPQMGEFASRAYESTLEELFRGSVDEEIRLKAADLADKYKDPEVFDAQMSRYLAEMSENAQDQWRGYIKNAGSVYQQRVKAGLRQAARARVAAQQKESFALTMDQELQNIDSVYREGGVAADILNNEEGTLGVPYSQRVSSIVANALEAGVISRTEAAQWNERIEQTKTMGLLRNSMEDLTARERQEITNILVSGQGTLPDNPAVEQALGPHRDDFQFMQSLAQQYNAEQTAITNQQVLHLQEHSEQLLLASRNLSSVMTSPEEMIGALDLLFHMKQSERFALGTGQPAADYTAQRQEITTKVGNSILVGLAKEKLSSQELDLFYAALQKNETRDGATDLEKMFVEQMGRHPELKDHVLSQYQGLKNAGAINDEVARLEDRLDLQNKITAFEENRAGLSPSDLVGSLSDLAEQHPLNADLLKDVKERASRHLRMKAFDLIGNSPMNAIHRDNINAWLFSDGDMSLLNPDLETNTLIHEQLAAARTLLGDDDDFIEKMNNWVHRSNTASDRNNEKYALDMALYQTAQGTSGSITTNEQKIAYDNLALLRAGAADAEQLLSMFGNGELEWLGDWGEIPSPLAGLINGLLSGSNLFPDNPEAYPQFMGALIRATHQPRGGVIAERPLYHALDEAQQGALKSMMYLVQVYGNSGYEDYYRAKSMQLDPQDYHKSDDYFTSTTSWRDFTIELMLKHKLPVSSEYIQGNTDLVKAIFAGFPATQFEEAEKVFKSTMSQIWSERPDYMAGNSSHTMFDPAKIMGPAFSDWITFVSEKRVLVDAVKDRLNSVPIFLGPDANVRFVEMPLSSRANARYIVQAKIDNEWVALTHQVTPEKEIAITVSTSDANFRPQFGMDVNQSALNLQIGILEKNDAYKQWQKDHVPEVQTWFLKANTQAPDADPPPMSENVANYFAITNAISDIKSGEYSHDQLAILLKAMADFDEREIVPAVKDLMDLK